MNWMHNW